MNQPLGGTLINRECADSERDDKTRYAASLPALRADRNLILEVEKIANGTFSPLVGFMGRADCEAVLKTMHMVDGTPWTIPIVFHASPEATSGLTPGDDVAIINEAEESISAILTVSEVYRYDKKAFAQSVFGTTDEAHPGVGQLMGWGDALVAGTIELVAHSKSLIPSEYDLSPADVRAEFERRGWRRIVGFQTRNVGHRAHEYLQKTALEHADGLLVHPLIGWKKKGDMMPDVLLQAYEILIDAYYVKPNVMMAGLTTAMRYAGPKEAVFHAIIRKNFGCTHFIVGRDHAGVGDYYEKYAGHALLRQFGTELGIQPMLLHGPCWCDRCESIVTEHTCPHPDDWVQISGTQIRAMLSEGKRPPESYMRPEVADFLIAKTREGRVLF